MTARIPLLISSSLHLGFAVLILLVYFAQGGHLPTQKVELEVIISPKLASPQLKLQPPVAASAPPPPTPARQVFGVSRKALTADASDASAATVKLGNTVAKSEDKLKLNADDADSLPIPTDEFLVTAMPKLKSEFRIPYPPEAKRASAEGPVVMDLLIDKAGKVRQVDLVKGPGFGLNEAAVDAVKKFEFEPAHVQAEAVAVKIRYTYRFVLEGS